MKPDGQTPADLGVLFVTGVFPPVNTAGSFRLMRFTSWMRRAGWRVSVLTLEPGGGEPLDRTLLDRLPSGIEIKARRAYYPLRWLARVKKAIVHRKQVQPGAANDHASADLRPAAEGGSSLRTSIVDLFSVPDQDSGWWPRASWAGIRMARSQKVDAIVSSGPPHTSHLVALSIKIATGRAWVADLRDPWARTSWHGRRGWSLRLNQMLEQMCVKRADRVVLNTNRLLDNFRSFYPELPQSKFCCVTNGFDEDSVRMGCASEGRSASDGPKRVRITHAGNLYGERDPFPLLDALRELLQSGRLNASDVEVLLIGTSDEELRLAERVQSGGLSDIVRLQGKVPHLEALEISAQSDILLLIQQGAPMQTPSKLFEYMALKKPVLALAGDGSTADIIRQGRLGFAVSPDDHEGIKSALLAMTSPDFGFAPDQEFIRQFSGEQLSRDFERIVLDAALARGEAPPPH